MKRPLAYITAAWRGDPCEVTEQAADYCRSVYEAGFSPICPTLYLPLFLHDAVPQEHKDGTDMGRDLLRRSRVLVVCGCYRGNEKRHRRGPAAGDHGHHPGGHPDRQGPGPEARAALMALLAIVARGPARKEAV